MTSAEHPRPGPRRRPSAAKRARCERHFAFPPRSPVAAISGVPRAVQMAGGLGAQAADSRLLPSIFVGPDAAS